MALEAPPRFVRCPACGESHTLAPGFQGVSTNCVHCGKTIPLMDSSKRPGLKLPDNEMTTDLRGTTPPAAAPSAAPEAPVPSSKPAATPAPATPEAEPDPLLDTVLGKCHLQRRLGEGGMGAVYLARHLTLDVPVAVKVLPQALAQRDRAFVDRFLREARTAAQIHHPNIVQVLDVDFQRGCYFLVMEYVEGETAGMRMRRKRMLSEREVCEIGLNVASALEYARRKSIVHRDVKPENILISKEGEIKLADLGLAKRVSGEAGSDLTLRDQALGTPFYISPEQATNARAADHRSDLYSLGATLFHLATGRPPFEGTSSFHTMTMHLNVPAPELRAYRAELSLEFAGVIRRLLSKNPGERFQTAGELFLALRALLERLAPASERDLGIPGALVLSRETAGTPTPATPATFAGGAYPTPAGTPAAPPQVYVSPVAPATPAPTPVPQHVTPPETDRLVVVYPVNRPSRFWLWLLFIPFANWLSYLWVGTMAKKAEWLYGGLALLLFNLLLIYFSNEMLAQLGIATVYLGAIAHGLGIRREAEFRAIELTRAGEEELQRSIGREVSGTTKPNG
ncbi:MAG: serine/threonine protein kinase [Planctomycetota bacterium]|nr:serine/threonine protein kinase [Planctomycetota bacterium]